MTIIKHILKDCLRINLQERAVTYAGGITGALLPIIGLCGINCIADFPKDFNDKLKTLNCTINN